MPSRSRSQQRLFGYIHAVQKGEAKNAPAKIKSMAQRVDPQDAKDFASTSHEGLPEKSAALVRRAMIRALVKKACTDLKRGKMRRGFSKSITKKAASPWGASMLGNMQMAKNPMNAYSQGLSKAMNRPSQPNNPLLPYNGNGVAGPMTAQMPRQNALGTQMYKMPSPPQPNAMQSDAMQSILGLLS